MGSQTCDRAILPGPFAFLLLLCPLLTLWASPAAADIEVVSEFRNPTESPLAMNINAHRWFGMGKVRAHVEMFSTAPTPDTDTTHISEMIWDVPLGMCVGLDLSDSTYMETPIQTLKSDEGMSMMSELFGAFIGGTRESVIQEWTFSAESTGLRKTIAGYPAEQFLHRASVILYSMEENIGDTLTILEEIWIAEPSAELTPILNWFSETDGIRAEAVAETFAAAPLTVFAEGQDWLTKQRAELDGLILYREMFIEHEISEGQLENLPAPPEPWVRYGDDSRVLVSLFNYEVKSLSEVPSDPDRYEVLTKYRRKQVEAPGNR